nr:transglycosylase domain-containing protein [uncultured Noviherbaspirillum sp.]
MENKGVIARGGWMRATGRLLRHMTGVVLVAGVAIALILAGLVWTTVKETPDVDHLRTVRAVHPSIVLAADGSELTTLRSVQREWIPLEKISPHVVHALVDTEDKRFYEHPGVDVRRTLAAAFHTANGDTQGGSTITQQLVRNLYPEEIGRARTVNRKLREIITATRIEQRYTKDEILETYLNTVPFLYNVYGIEMAARTYFGKSASDLGALEGATLVGMLKGTHYYNPVVNPERARSRRNVVLAQMVRGNHLDDEEFRRLRGAPLGLNFQRQAEPAGSATHFTEHVRKWLNEWAERNNRDLGAEGLVIQTTLDPKMQALAAEAVARQSQVLQAVADVEWGTASARLLSKTPAAYEKMQGKVQPFRYLWTERNTLLDAFLRETPEFRRAVAADGEAATLAKLKQDSAFIARLQQAKTRLEAGFVAMDPASGEVRAWVGSRDFQRDQYDHVAQAERQPGSTFKPFVYGAALERGFEPDRMYADGPVEIRLGDGRFWRPADMGGASGRQMSLRDGLVYSKNTITAQVMQDVGVNDIVTLARAAGVNRSRLDAVPSLALGTSPVTLLEMVSSYGTIARGGEYREPIFIRSIKDREGRTLVEFSKPPVRVMSERTSTELIDMMRGVVSRGTGTAMKSRFQVAADIAGKTGTTQNNTDGWFILMHPNLVVGSWVGFNDARVTMRSDYWGQGGHNALLLVGDFFRAAVGSGMLDVKASFPRPPRPALMATAPPPAMMDDQGEVVTSTALAEQPQLPAPTTSANIVVRRYAGGGVWAGDSQAAAMEDAAPARSAEEVGAIMGGMGRDPATGARMAARSAVDYGNASPVLTSGASSGGDTGAGAEPDPLR